jgi:hypothetical protein
LCEAAEVRVRAGGDERAKEALKRGKLVGELIYRIQLVWSKSHRNAKFPIFTGN